MLNRHCCRVRVFIRGLGDVVPPCPRFRLVEGAWGFFNRLALSSSPTFANLSLEAGRPAPNCIPQMTLLTFALQ